MKRKTTNTGLLYSFLICGVSGLMKFPTSYEIAAALGVSMPWLIITRIHDLSGVILIIFAIFHIWQHRTYYKKG
jgi:hypothetical protein